MVVVNGATGAFGIAAVAVALTLGAVRVVATGRSGSALDRLARDHGARVRPAVMTGDATVDQATITAAAGMPIDVVFDILPSPPCPSR